ncbi:LysR family transcriptional regulator [Sphingomonas adhaesiva]|uniref:LysR family transcriptional regulator n=1 Tax=Sphingomonas adhaesiva TaxID=28212 RepID=UPI002FF91D3E
MIDLEPRLLRAFLAIYDARGVAAAGRRLGVTQPTMSGHLKRLRSHFKDPLFVAGRGGLAPTAKSEEVRSIIAEVIEGLNKLAAAASGWSPTTSDRRFRLMASGYVQAVVSEKLDERLGRAAPRVSVEFVQPASGAELAFCDAYILPVEVTPNHHKRAVAFRDRFICVINQRSASSAPPLTLDAFCQSEHILLAPAPSPPHAAVDAALAKLGRNRRIARVASDLSSIQRLLAKPNRLAMIPARLAVQLGQDLSVFPPPLPLAPIDFALSWPDIADDDSGRTWFRQTLSTCMSRIDQIENTESC